MNCSIKLISLSIWDEIVGELREVHIEPECLLATVGSFRVVLPRSLIDLRGAAGRRVAILRTDSGYRWRILGGDVEG